MKLSGKAKAMPDRSGKSPKMSPNKPAKLGHMKVQAKPKGRGK